MDYEKEYKEALERMKSWAKGEHPECFSEARKAAEFIFPELKESEDEKIIKIIKKVLWDCNEGNQSMIGDKDVAKCIAWLEKQKPIEWVEEDSLMKDKTINYINTARMYVDVERIPGQWADECINWLKSLKERIKK